MKKMFVIILSYLVYFSIAAQTKDEQFLTDQYIECVLENVAAFMPAEMDTNTAKTFALTRVLSVPYTKTYTIGEIDNEDSLVVTWSYLSQEDYKHGLIESTGKLSIEAEIKNFTSESLSILIEECSIVDNKSESYPILSSKAVELKNLRPNAKAKYDIISYIKDEFSSNIVFVSTFTVYLEVRIGDKDHTLEQKFVRIPWAKGELKGD